LRPPSQPTRQRSGQGPHQGTWRARTAAAWLPLRLGLVESSTAVRASGARDKVEWRGGIGGRTQGNHSTLYAWPEPRWHKRGVPPRVVLTSGRTTTKLNQSLACVPTKRDGGDAPRPPTGVERRDQRCPHRTLDLLNAGGLSSGAHLHPYPRLCGIGWRKHPLPLAGWDQPPQPQAPTWLPSASCTTAPEPHLAHLLHGRPLPTEINSNDSDRVITGRRPGCAHLQRPGRTCTAVAASRILVPVTVDAFALA
jgi:hypothetical protein